jgi:hypothetical protein
MSDNKVLDQIQKLLALSTSPFPEEANAAMAKAQSLMARHNISMTDVEDQELKDYGETPITFDFAMDTKYIQLLLHRFFFVQVLIYSQRKTWLIVGLKSNVEIARFMVDHIKRKFSEAWWEFKERTGKDGVEGKTDFYKGLYAGLCEKLEAERKRLKDEEGLVWLGDPKVQEWIRENHGVTGKHKTDQGRVRGDRDAQQSGYQAGRTMTLNQAVDTTRTNSQKQLGGS